MSLRHVLVLAIIPLCGCNSLLGIEDLQVKPDAGVAQREQEVTGTQDAGTKAAATSGTGSVRPPAPKEPDAGKPADADSGTKPKTAGNDAPRPTQAAGSGGAPAETTSPVTGTLVDYRRRKLTGVSIRIGDQQTTTNAEGKFTIPDVASRYDVTILIQTSINNATANFIWQFQGLSRRDPTLQVFRGLPENFAEFRSHIDNVTFPLMTDQTILLGWSSPDGDFSTDTTYVDLEYLSPMWTGPAMSPGTAHALLLTTSGGIPSQYHAYDTQSVVMTANMQGQASFDLGKPIPQSTVVKGAVTGNPSLGDRHNEVYLRFRDQNTALKLVDQWSAADSFEYPVPNLPGSSLTVVAKSVANPPGIAAAYAEVEPGGPQLTLELPALPTLTAPDDGKTNIDGDTEFHWNGSAHVFLLAARSIPTNDAIYVVTEAKQTRLPIGIQFGYTPQASSDFSWSVEVHDTHATIDEATGEVGHLSAYAAEDIRGPKRGPGTFARSVPRYFTTTP
jgi:hypothetical protein